MIKFSNKSLVGLALVLSFFVALLVYNFLSNVQPNSNKTSTVVVARTEILANTLITSDMVEEVQISGKQLKPGAISDLGRVVGAYAKENIPAQAQITENRVLNSDATGFAGSIPHDKRAVSIAVTDVTGVTGLIKPGDYVDVIAVVESGSSDGSSVANMIIQNVLVLATNKTVARDDKGTVAKDYKVTTVTVAVTPDQAVEVGLAGTKGTVTFALRPFAPADGGTAYVTAKTLDNLRGNAGYTSPVVSAPVAAPVPTPPTGLLSMLEGMFPPTSKSVPANMHYGKAIPVIKGTTVQDVYVQ